jgi:hypothetical protein
MSFLVKNAKGDYRRLMRVWGAFFSFSKFGTSRFGISLNNEKRNVIAESESWAEDCNN